MPFSKNFSAPDRATFILIIVIALCLTIMSCKRELATKPAFAKAKNSSISSPTSDLGNSEPRTLTQEWKRYWYAGEAEITSYTLEQARYGEMRAGTATLIFVTEDFLPAKQVKADRSYTDNIAVLKLNATKKFTTGIYPYSAMTSTFYPIQYKNHAIKISQSIQEWCGHVYAQLNNKRKFEIRSHSYFESEGDQNITLPKTILENELWTQIRINPEDLPTGSFDAVPNLEYIRLKHIEIKAYTALGTLRDGRYTIDYPALNRSLTIIFDTDFPYAIQGWEEKYVDSPSGTPMTTRGTKLETIKSAYWNKNSNADAYLREQLQLSK